MNVKLVLFLCLVMTTPIAQADEGYQLPPKDIVDIIDAPPVPSVSFSPDRQWMLMVQRDAMPSIGDVSRRMLRLAGMRIDPAANGRFVTSYNKGLSLRKMNESADSLGVTVPIPEGAKLAGTSWAHDNKSFIFILVTDKGQDLWAVDVEDPAKPKKIAENLTTVMGGVQWMPDAKHVVCRLVPEDRGDEPESPAFPDGPNIQESSGNKSPTRTYQDLLTSPFDEDLFEYYAVGQPAIVGLDGSIKKISAPGVYSGLSPSPDGEHFLVTKIKKPFSYLMTYRSFPKSIEVWDLDGKVVHTVADIPLESNIPIEGVRTGPRNVDWMSSRKATLVWAEALDGGDPNTEAEHRDQLKMLAAPFTTEASDLMKIEHRSYGLSYFADPMEIATTEYDRDRRWIRTLMHDLNNPTGTPKKLVDRSIRDRYGDPGRIVEVRDDSGHSIVLQDGDTIYRLGAGASPVGNLPFIDSQNLVSMETNRVWRCEEGTYESVVAIVKSDSDKAPMVVTSRETETTPPNYFLRDFEAKTDTALTSFADPTPQIRGIKKQIVKYERNDGVPLSATLYLPADYKEGTRLPLLVWAYPREFNDSKTAGQISGSPSRFTRIASISHLALLTQGYAIMDAATMPVIGDPETMNDTFIEQIVAAAQAAIDKAVEMGVADRDRVCVGGHSYGAFMTANLMAHCDLFKAGVARSGAYNRTLTPFGFQSERRSYWDAKDIYHSISPFMHANKINEPLLLIHGENDNNSGTFPVQSKRLYQAIKGNGGTTRLVMLPYESHGYRARESVLHTHAETIKWFDKYVKNASAENSSK